MDSQNSSDKPSADKMVASEHPQPVQKASSEPQKYFHTQPTDLYNRTKTPFLIYATDVLVNSTGLFQSTYFTIPYSTFHMLGQELQRILEDPRCQIPGSTTIHQF